LKFSNRSVLGRLDEDFLDRLLGIADEKCLAPGETLCEAGSAFDGAYLVTEGRLLEHAVDGEARELAAGDVVDELQLLTGGVRSQTLAAVEPTRVLKFAADRFRMLVVNDDPLLESLYSLVSERLRDEQLASILQRLFGPLDDAVRQRIRKQIAWLELEAGKTLFCQSDPGDALYALMDGRMAAYAETGTGQVFLNEILPGETIGEIAIITGAARSATVKATKRSLLVRLARADFDAIAEEHPIVYKAFAQVLVAWLQRSHDDTYLHKEAREIALLAHRREPDVMQQVAPELERALAGLGPTLRLSSSILKELGSKYLFDAAKVLAEPFYHPANTRFRLWLDEQKRRHAFILYQSDGDGSVWDRLCIDRAHEALIVAGADADPSPGPVELLLKDEQMTVRRLALVYDVGQSPEHTARWLQGRSLAGHHHVRTGRIADFERLGRFLAGQAIGLVLAGGGARGFAHIGIIRALHESGIPIDLVGGTSSGGIIAVTYAMEPDPDVLEARNQKEWVARKPLNRYAVPILSLLDHTKWDRIFLDAFRRRGLEDLWLTSFSVSCNLDTGQTVIHDSGPAWKAVRATSSLPVFLAPALFDGHGHVDGGVVNNMPTDIMRRMTRGPVFAVGLGHEIPEKLPLEAYPSPWRLVLEKIPGLRNSHEHHTVPKVIMRLATMQDQAAFEDRAKLADFMFLPPVGKYSMTDIKYVDEIVIRGHAYGLECLQHWAKDEAFVQRLKLAGVDIQAVQA